MFKRPAPLLAAALAFALAFAALPGCGTGRSGDAREYGYRVVREYPHSRDSFTEGLLLDEGFFYEGTGLYGESKLMRIDPATGRPLLSTDLGPEYFGEGVTILGDEVFQLTWQNNAGFVYDKDDLAPERTFTYPTEGWGLTTDGKSLIMSDGSAALRFLDPESLEVERTVAVADQAGPVRDLNELEYVDGVIYANVWKQDRIAVISPGDGRVKAWIDLTGLNPYTGRDAAEYVLNGIAWDPDSGHLVVTGKCWPRLYEIELVER